VFDSESGCRAQYSYGQLQRAANRLSNALSRLGLQPGDRVALLLPQRFEMVVALLAINQVGAVAVPLASGLSPDALAQALQDSAAQLAIAEAAQLPALRRLRPRSALQTLMVVNGPQTEVCGNGEIEWLASLQAEDARFEPLALPADAPALLLYEGAQGVLLPQRALLGSLSGFVASQNWFGFAPEAPAQPSAAMFWTPEDWACRAGLLGGLLPTLYFGRPILGYWGPLTAQRVLELLQGHGVTHCNLPQHALPAVLDQLAQAREQASLRLQALACAVAADGSALSPALQQSAQVALGLTINQCFGLAESGAVLGDCSALWSPRPGSLGRAYPGHRLRVIDAAGRACAAGEPGELALQCRDVHGSADPALFIGYWCRSDAPALEGLRTGLFGMLDTEGYFWPQAAQAQRLQ